MSRPSQVKQGLARLAAAAVLLFGGGAIAAAAPDNPPPSAAEILRGVRLSQTGQHRELTGQLRNGPNVTPFRLVLDGPLIRYEFANPALVLQLRLGEKDSRLEELADGDRTRVTPARFDATVRGTDVTYEDLSLQFLYWPKATVTGEATAMTRRCWKVTALAPGSSQYSRVDLWVDEASGSLLRVEGYGDDGKILRRFEVRSGQKIDGGWMLKQMRIEHMVDGKPRDKEPTYLEITAAN